MRVPRALAIARFERRFHAVGDEAGRRRELSPGDCR
jgi:hypothetical protein